MVAMKGKENKPLRHSPNIKIGQPIQNHNRPKPMPLTAKTSLISKQTTELSPSSKSKLDVEEAQKLRSENGKLKSENLKLAEQNKTLSNDLVKVKNNLDILGQSWICDETIAAYFEVLTCGIIGIKGKVHLLNPIISQSVKTVNDFNVFLDPLHLEDKDYIIAPINDCVEKQVLRKEGGSHWSVLVFEKLKGKFHYFDSLGNHNLSSAEIVAKKLLKYFGFTQTPEIITIKGPIQKNTYDCGIFTLAAVDSILMHVTQGESLCDLTLPDLTPMDCIKKRAYVAYVIYNSYLINKDILKAFMCRPIINTSKLFCSGERISSFLRKPNVAGSHNKNRRVEEARNKILVNRPNIKRVKVVGDSHARGLAPKLLSLVNSNFTVEGMVKPSAKLDAITDSVQSADCLILLAGANDVYGGGGKDCLKKIEQFIESSKSPMIIIGNIPYRYDLPQKDFINSDIFELNMNLQDLIKRKSNLKLLDLYGLPRHYHTKHGLHLNNKGKKHLSKVIADMLSSGTSNTTSQTLNDSLQSISTSETEVDQEPKSTMEMASILHPATSWRSETVEDMSRSQQSTPVSSELKSAEQPQVPDTELGSLDVIINRQPSLELVVECPVNNESACEVKSPASKCSEFLGFESPQKFVFSEVRKLTDIVNLLEKNTCNKSSDVIVNNHAIDNKPYFLRDVKQKNKKP